jgi:hypothetical protein
MAYLHNLISELGDRLQTSQLAARLPGLLDRRPGSTPATDRSSVMLLNLQEGLYSHKQTGLAANLQAFIGLGAGLTPAGDDLIAGYLLALRRWGDVLAPEIDQVGLSQAILDKAYTKTTRLAANLMECAAQGQADERLIWALDGIATGEILPAEAAAYLGAWGSTSGLEALAGMALVLM